MADDISIKGFHGTDEKYVESILNDGFIIKTSDSHWLGNGIYFFNEVELAKWWATNPSNNFGCHSQKPAIIVVKLSCEYDRMFDMRQYKSYQCISDAYIVYSQLLKGKTFDNPKKLRCAFFDWFYKRHGLYLIIACFLKDSPTYFNRDIRSTIKSLEMSFPEIQYCVYNNEIIKSKKIYGGEEDA